MDDKARGARTLRYSDRRAERFLRSMKQPCAARGSFSVARWRDATHLSARLESVLPAKTARTESTSRPPVKLIAAGSTPFAHLQSIHLLVGEHAE
jgi:hypothetical protein